MSRFVVVPNGFIMKQIRDDRLCEQIKRHFIQVRNEASQHSDIHISFSDESHELSVVGRESMLADVTIYDIYCSLLTQPSLVARLDITSENLEDADTQLSARAQASRERFNAYIPRFNTAYSMLNSYLNDDQYNGWIAHADSRTVSAYRSHLEDARLAQQEYINNSRYPFDLRLDKLINLTKLMEQITHSITPEPSHIDTLRP